MTDMKLFADCTTVQLFVIQMLADKKISHLTKSDFGSRAQFIAA